MRIWRRGRDRQKGAECREAGVGGGRGQKGQREGKQGRGEGRGKGRRERERPAVLFLCCTWLVPSSGR